MELSFSLVLEFLDVAIAGITADGSLEELLPMKK
jgi:hypothetical protein